MPGYGPWLPQRLIPRSRGVPRAVGRRHLGDGRPAALSKRAKRQQSAGSGPSRSLRTNLGKQPCENPVSSLCRLAFRPTARSVAALLRRSRSHRRRTWQAGRASGSCVPRLWPRWEPSSGVRSTIFVAARERPGLECGSNVRRGRARGWRRHRRRSRSSCQQKPGRSLPTPSRGSGRPAISALNGRRAEGRLCAAVSSSPLNPFGTARSGQT